MSGTQPSDLINLCEFTLRDKWTLLYRGTRDEFGANDFHSKCDNHNNTLIILKAEGSSFIFGGFTSTDWDCSGLYKSDPNAFLFSLTNRDNIPSKMKQINTNNSIYCSSCFGPIFGSGHDLFICDSSNTIPYCHSNLGVSYQLPLPSQSVSYLAGYRKFLLDEIEVYQKE